MGAPAAKLDDRSLLLSKLGPRGWYVQHLVDSTSCGCTVDRPARSCDVGESLFRLREVMNLRGGRGER